MKKASKSIKIIVDTNVWISFLIGKSLKGLQAYIDSQAVLIVTCNEQILELSEVFKQPKIKKHFTSGQIDEFFELLGESSVNIILNTKTELCRDLKDNFLLSLAIDSKSDYLITGDNDLLILENVQKTKIIKFNEFEKIMIPRRESSTR